MTEKVLTDVRCLNVLAILRDAPQYKIPRAISAVALLWLADRGYVLVMPGSKGTYSKIIKGQSLPI